MSARDSLDMALSRGVHLTQSVRQSLIDNFAHELAERIRNEDVALGGETYQRGWSFQDAADLIDPES